MVHFSLHFKKTTAIVNLSDAEAIVSDNCIYTMAADTPALDIASSPVF